MTAAPALDQSMGPIPLGAIRRLPGDAGLPTAAVAPGERQQFIGARGDDGAEWLGVVGVERLDGATLLRSLAVAPEARRRGLGRQLVAGAEDLAHALGARNLCLLTTTAADYFAAPDCVRIDRGAAPDVPRATAHFASLCPASAAVMRKALAGAAVR